MMGKNTGVDPLQKISTTKGKTTINHCSHACRSVALTLALATIVIRVQAEEPKWHGTVNVEYRGDPSMEDNVNSYLKRELRSLSDVEVLKDSRADFTLQVIGIRNALKDGRTIGYSLSILITEPLDTNMLASLSGKSYVATMYSGNVFVAYHDLICGPDLRTLCTSIVNDFDAHQLEESRNTFATFLKLVREQKEQKGIESNRLAIVPKWEDTEPTNTEAEVSRAAKTEKP